MKLFKSKKSWAVGLMLCAGIGAGTATASSQLYWEGLINQNEIKGSGFWNLTSSEGLSVYGSTVCMKAIPDGGQVMCTQSNTGVGKPYNGSQRSAQCRPAEGHSVTAKCRAVYN